MKLSLSAKIRLLVIGVCVGFGLAVLGLFNWFAARHLQSITQSDIQSVTQTLDGQIKIRKKYMEKLVSFVANSPRVEGLSTSDSQTIRDAMPALRQDVGYDLSITDDRGILQDETGFKIRRENQVNDLPVRNALEGRPWSGVVVREGIMFLAVSQPIRVAGTLHGTITAYDRLEKEFATEARGSASLEIGFVFLGHVTSSTLDLPRNMTIPSGKTWTLIFHGVEYVGSYSPLELAGNSNMGFCVLRSKKMVLEAYTKFSQAFISSLCLVTLVALVGGSAFSSGIARSLDQLVRSVYKLKNGEWPEPIEVHRSDEIGLLEGAFNEMAQSLHQSQERLISMLDVCPLTEVDNHRRFKERLAEEAARTEEAGQSLTMLLVDIDDFSSLNERLGHSAGDLALKELANLLRQHKSEYASVARFEGDKFAVLIPNASIEDAEHLFESVRKSLSGFSISGGGATRESAKGQTDGLIVASELALERAKQLGKKRFCDYGAVPGSLAAEPLRLYARLQEGTYSTVKALAAAVDAKDPYTHGHSDRVAKYAAELAAYVGASSEEVERVLQCGTLHDIGKIGVPDAILQKPGKLDADEFRAMQTHPVLGVLIVNKIPQLEDLLPGVRHHHERYDGKGYPDGLSGENIPKMARYLAIADTFDAMTSDRPYRKGLPVARSLDEIELGAGTQFDPALATAFVEMMRKAPVRDGLAATVR